MANSYAGDCRRACALVVSHARGDVPGMNAILEESVETARVTELIFALLDTYQSLLPILVTDVGLAALSQCVLALARPDNTDDADTRRAAAIIVAHSRDDLDGINAVIREVKDVDRVTPLICTILNVYRAICPVIPTPVGIAALSKTVLDLAVKENADL